MESTLTKPKRSAILETSPFNEFLAPIVLVLKMMLIAVLLAQFTASNCLAQDPRDSRFRVPGSQKQSVCGGRCGGDCGPCASSDSSASSDSAAEPSDEILSPGTPHQRYPNVIWNESGKLSAAPGYRWRSNKKGDYRVERLFPGTPHGKYPNVVWAEGGQVRAAPGYEWLSQTPGVDGDFRVKLLHGLIRNADGTFSPALAYRWVASDGNDLRVALRPGLIESASGGVTPARPYRWVSSNPNDLRIELRPGLIRNANGTISPAAAYRFVSPNDPNNFEVEPIAGASSNYPNVVWAEGSKLLPAKGYQWVSQTPGVGGDYRVEPIPDTPSTYPNVVWAAGSKLLPATGYQWVSQTPGVGGDYRVEPIPDTPSTYPNVVWAAGTTLRPVTGYDWVSPGDPNDFRVQPLPGLIQNEDGSLKPAPGYRFVSSTPGDYTVEQIPLSATSPRANAEQISRLNSVAVERVWDSFHQNLDIARGLAPEENKCALRLSMTLGLIPREGEASLKDIGNGVNWRTIVREIKKSIKGPDGTDVLTEVKEAELGKRYYIRAQDLANRLKDEWGKPKELTRETAKQQLRNRIGVIFFKGGFGPLGNDNHIDLWDGEVMKWVADTETTFEKATDRADQIWFWEMRK